MNELKLRTDRYPLTADRLAEMQDTYMHIGSAIGDIRRHARKYNFIVSGCRSNGESGYVVYDGQIYNVLSTNNTSLNSLKLVETEVKVDDNGNNTVVSVERHFEWSADGELYYPDMRRMSVKLAHPDTEMVPIMTAGNNPMEIPTILCGWVNGKFLIEGKYNMQNNIGVRLQLPADAIPTHDVAIPVKVAGVYKMVVPDVSTGVIVIEESLPSDAGIPIEINAVIEEE